MDSEIMKNSFIETLIMETQKLSPFSDKYSKLVNFLVNASDALNLDHEQLEKLHYFKNSTNERINCRLFLFERQMMQYKRRDNRETLNFTNNYKKEFRLIKMEALIILEEINDYCLSILYPKLLDMDLAKEVYKRR